MTSLTWISRLYKILLYNHDNRLDLMLYEAIAFSEHLRCLSGECPTEVVWGRGSPINSWYFGYYLDRTPTIRL